MQVILEPTDRSINQGMRLIALVYLCIGLYVLFRRWTAPEVDALLHLLPGLVRAVRVPVHGRAGSVGLDDLLGQDPVAQSLQPALFLHFAVSFAERRGRRCAAIVCASWICWSALLYVPGVFLIGLQAGRHPVLVGDRDAEAPAGPDRRRLSCALLRALRRWSSACATCARSRRWSGSS